VLLVLRLSAARVQFQQVTIQTEDGKQTVLARPDIESLPHVKVATHGAENEGVARKTVLHKEGVRFGHSMRGKR
jgi:hypothetical protein